MGKYLADLQLWITNISEALLLINAVLCAKYLLKVSQAFRVWTYFQLFTLLILIVAKILWLEHDHNKSINNLPLLHFYTLVEFALLTLFYHQVFNEIPVWRKFIVTFSALVIGLILANSIFLQPITVFNTYSKTLTQVIFIFYAVFFFSQSMHNRAQVFYPAIKIINSAILLYYAGSLFIFMFSNVFFQLDEFHRIFWVANALLYLIFQLLVFYAIWQFRQTKSTYS